MSDFPKGGDIEATRAWLDKEGFVGKFIGWKADAIWGKSDDYIKSQFSPEDQERAEILCGLLSTARQTPSPGVMGGGESTAAVNNILTALTAELTSLRSSLSGATARAGSAAIAAGPLRFAAPLLPPDIIQFKIISIDGTRLSLAGLGFRNYIANRCREIGLCGYVWRVPITDAMILASGTPEQIEHLKAALRTLEQNFYFASFLVVHPECPVVSSTFAVLPSTHRSVDTGLYSNRELDEVDSCSDLAC